MKSLRVAANVVYGATGAGKTALIAHLLALRPRGQRWAVLQNDFGTGDLEGAPGSAQGDVTVRAVSGCICCTARVALRGGIIALLRQARPQRLLIEASSAAEPRAIAAVLNEPGISAALNINASLCVVSPRHLKDERYIGSEVYRQQLAAADAIVLGGDTAQSHSETRAALLKLTQPGGAVIDIAAVALGTLDEPERSDPS